jgi:Xaa-Pro aminopeptidase
MENSPINYSIKHSEYEARRRRVLAQIDEGVAIFPAGKISYISRSSTSPFKSNSDFFYLTGFDEAESVLILKNTGGKSRSILFVPERDPFFERWQGFRLGTKRARARFKVDEVRDVATLPKDFSDLLRGATTIHYAMGADADVDDMVVEMLSPRSRPTGIHPFQFSDSRVITSEMRFVKSDAEIQILSRAIKASVGAFRDFLPHAPHIHTERDAARILEALFVQHGGEDLAFTTIMAAGGNSSQLHHEPTGKVFKKSELLLIDAGCTTGRYVSDLTRTIPLGGRYSAPQRALYDIVEGALTAGKKKSRRGTTLNAIYHTVVHELTTGLIEEGLLKGRVSKNIKNQSFRKYFMTKASHPIGIDTHDAIPLLSPRTKKVENAYERPLVPGVIFTIEPGIYIDLTEQSVPKHFRGIGIRIEDNVVITKSGAKNLSEELPTKSEEIEALLASEHAH